MDDENINKFMLSECNKYLSSVGMALKKNKPINNKVFERYQQVFDSFKTLGYTQGVEILIDSAGYQFQTGQIKKNDCNKFVDYYHEFLTKNVEKVDYAFLFDPVPGASKSIVNSYSEMVKLNKMSYEKACELPEELRDKLLYIHHFRTPKIYKMYRSFLEEYKYPEYFKNFSTGGLVSFSRGSGSNPPIILYTIPLVDILTHVKERGLKSFRWHILGSTEWKDILVHKFVEHHIKKVYNIDIEITYDSSTIFQTLARGRYLYVPDMENQSVWKMSLRSDSLKMKFRDKGTAETYLYKLYNDMAREYGFKILDPITDPIYVDCEIDEHTGLTKGGRMSKIMYNYGIFSLLRLFNLIETWSKDIVDMLYPLYESGHIDEFNKSIENIMLKFNNGKLSNTIYQRTSSVYNSLELLRSLDKDYCEYIVNKYMYMDEPSELKSLDITYF